MIETMDPTGLQRGRTRRSVAPGGSIVTKREEPPSAYLVESGVVAVSVALDRTPPTCVELLGSGTLIGWPSDAGPYASEFRAISSVNLMEIPSGLLRLAMQRQPALQEAYLQQLRERIAQTELVAVCNAHHSLEGRCAHWLLKLHAHLGAVLPVTHAFLATMLGVRRAGISITLEMLQREGLIRQRRGSIEVLDAEALGPYACPCSNAVSRPAHAISADLIGDDIGNTSRPRIWFEREIDVPAAMALAEDERGPRREAALRLCRSIVAHGLTALQQAHLD
jgi:CRP-like cAMP-binding protein